MFGKIKRALYEKLRKIKLFHYLIVTFGLYDLKEECVKYVRNKYGEECVEEFLMMYTNINRGIPIGGFCETTAFIDMIEEVKAQI